MSRLNKVKPRINSGEVASKQDQPRVSFRMEMLSLLEYMCKMSSSHGGSWEPEIKNRFFRILFLLTLMTLQISVCSFGYMALTSTAHETITTTSYGPKLTMPFPNMTICLPRTFSREKVDALDIHPNLTSYIMIGANPTLYLYQGQETNLSLTQLEDEYQKAKLRLGPDFVDRILLECSDFVIGCSVGIDGYLHEGKACCDKFFLGNPTFSAFGGCITTSLTFPIETAFGSLFRVSMVINASSSITPDMDPRVAPLKSLTNDALFALHMNDHPTAALMANSFRLSPGHTYDASVLTAEYSRENFRTHGSSTLWDTDNQDTCIVEEDEIFHLAQHLGFHAWSRRNCNLLMLDLTLPSCSLMETWGIRRTENLTMDEFRLRFPRFETYANRSTKICEPKDFFYLLDGSDRSVNVGPRVKKYCRPECLETNYDIKLSHSQHASPSELVPSLYRVPDEVIVLNIQLDSQNVAKHDMSPRTFGDKFATTGGLIGAIMGASAITMIEFGYFYLLIVKCVARHVWLRITSRTV